MVTLQDGRIVSFPNDPGASSLDTVLDWRSKTSRQGNEEGLLGLAFDPQFATNHDIYIYYSAAGGDRRTVVSRLTASGSGGNLTADPASELVILTVPQPYSNHNGGELAFGPDGMLYLGIGDGGSEGDPDRTGQDIQKNLLASIIRIDVRDATADHPYSIPPDNPFASSPNSARPETWAYGLRNPWRFSWDSEGRLIAGDVGQDRWEEVDNIVGGKNYGWSVMEASHCYRPSSNCDMRGLTLPLFEYSHDGGKCSITGGYSSRPGVAPNLGYVFGDYCSGAVWAVGDMFSSAGEPPRVTTLRENGPSISSFAQDTEGHIYVLTFDGKIQRIEP